MGRSSLYALAIAFAIHAVPARSEVILEIGTVMASQGSSGVIGVNVENTGSTGLIIGGFNFEIIGNAAIDFTGASFPTSPRYIFAGDSFDQANSLPLAATTGAALLAGDISNSGNGETLGAGQTAGLALVTFNVSRTAPLGPMTVVFSTDPAFTNLSDQNGISIELATLLSGTIDVTAATAAIPEPSAAAMLAAALLGLGIWRRVSPANRA
jgi:hypothetical protein